MTVSSTTSTAGFPGTGVLAPLPIPFRFFKDSDLVVLKRLPDGTSTTLNLNVDYGVTGAGKAFGGTVTPSVAAQIGELVTVSRILPVQQLTDLRNQGAYFPEIHEDAFDYLTMLIQQGFSIFDRALVRPPGQDYFDAQGFRISNLADAIKPQDAATKNNLDQAVAPLATKAALASEAAARAAGDASLQGQLTGGAGVVASQFSPLSWHDQIIPNSVTIPPNKNAWSFGPTMTIALGQVVIIGPGSFWTIANGATAGAGTLNTQLPNPLDLNV